MVNKKYRNLLFMLILAAILGYSQASNCFAQDQTKSIQSDEFIRNRPMSTSVNTERKVKPVYMMRKRTYPAVKTPIRVPRKVRVKSNLSEKAMLGLTIWKQGPAPKGEDAKGLIEEETGLERSESETPLAVGDRIRFSVESLSRKGYLYIVDRELYSDGTYGAPILVYPTLNNRSGSNFIGAGSSIFVPQSSNYFAVKPQQGIKNQVAEVLTIIVSPKVLVEESMLDKKAVELPPTMFANWLKQWEIDTTLYEQVNGAGTKITPVEQAAAAEAAKGLVEETPLSQNDPPPQTVYSAQIKRGDPFLVNVYLKFKSN